MALRAGHGAGLVEETLGQIVRTCAMTGEVVVVAFQVVDALAAFQHLVGRVVQAGHGVELLRVLVHAHRKGGELAQIERIGDGVHVLEHLGQFAFALPL